MLKKFSNGCVRIMNRWLPDPFLFAIILTIVVFIAAMVGTQQNPVELVWAWAGKGDVKDGLWGLLSFSMQMALVLVLGSALATAPICKKILRSIAGLAKSKMSAIVVTTMVSTLCCWLNWGFGLIIGALLAKEIARRVRDVDYPLLIASAYSGFVIWHAGLSGSIPLQMAGGKEFGKIVYEAPLTHTIFHPMNIIMCLAVLVLMPLINYAMHPTKEHTVLVNPDILEDEEARTYSVNTPAEKIEHSKILWALIVLMGFVYIVLFFIRVGAAKLDLNAVNGIFLFLGLLAHGDLRRYVDAIGDAAGGAAGVLLQFPFYAGIMGLMVAENSEGTSLAIIIARFFTDISNRRWTVGCSGPHRHAGCHRDCCPRRNRRYHLLWPCRHGYRLGRPVDQYDPALLGPACFGCGRAVCQGYYGISGCDPHLCGHRGLRRVPPLGPVLTGKLL